MNAAPVRRWRAASTPKYRRGLIVTVLSAAAAATPWACAEGDDDHPSDGNCYSGTAPPPSSTIVGSSFDAWEGKPVRGCLLAAQSFPSVCHDSTVEGGSFSFTAAVCTASGWEITVALEIKCRGGSGEVTPADCWCIAGYPPSSSGRPGSLCDAGSDVGDARSVMPDAITEEDIVDATLDNADTDQQSP